MISSFTAQQDKLNAYELAQTIAKSSGILKELYNEKEKGPEEVERYQNIEELLAGIKEFSISRTDDNLNTLAEFMIDVALLTDADEDKGDEKNHVTLMTIHASKGLEFPHVFLVGVEENLFPSQMVLNSRTELEEERRLFYVAVTRAKETCTLSYATSRFTFGNLISSEPSRFISEIDSKYIHFDTPQRGPGKSLNSEKPFTGGLNRKPLSTGSLFKTLEASNPNTQKSGALIELKVGYNVLHDRFGKGKITKLDGSGADKKATIFFPHHGSKTVLLRFANLKVVEE
jgi:DNA helicase-2/ATP-dependent DNA helicase PcrA